MTRVKAGRVSAAGRAEVRGGEEAVGEVEGTVATARAAEMEEAVMAADRMWVGLGEKRRPAEGRVVETAAVEMAVAAA